MKEVTPSPLILSMVLAAAAAKSLRLCPTLCDPRDDSPPGSPSLGFSRQEHWSGLPFPSPMGESEKWKWSCLVVSDSSWPNGLQATRLLHPWDCPGKSTGVGCHCLLRPVSIPVCYTKYSFTLNKQLSATCCNKISTKLRRNKCQIKHCFFR